MEITWELEISRRDELGYSLKKMRRSWRVEGGDN